LLVSGIFLHFVNRCFVCNTLNRGCNIFAKVCKILTHHQTIFFRFECHQILKSHEISDKKLGRELVTRHLHRLIFFRESFSISAIMALYILLLRSGVLALRNIHGADFEVLHCSQFYIMYDPSVFFL
jgi:hypothetical protein